MPPEPVRPTPGAHVGADQVADLLENLLPETETATVAAHLDACAECSQLRDDLAALPALLAGVGSPALPAEVAARLDAAVADAAAARQAEQRPAATGSSTVGSTVSSLQDRRRRFVTRTFTGVAAAAALVVGVLVVGDVVDQGGGDDQSAGGGSVADEGSAAGDGVAPQQRAPGATPGRLVRLTSDDFGPGARAVLSPQSGDQPEALRGPELDAVARVDGVCTGRDLRTARIVGAPGPPALLDRQPVTLVVSGPARRRLVVAYSCASGRPVEQQRALVDLTD
jgi:hypothetical protein